MKIPEEVLKYFAAEGRMRRLRRQKAGLCVRCTAPAADGVKLCEKHRVEASRAAKARAERLRTEGRCVSCGQKLVSR